MQDNRTPPAGASIARRGPLMVYLAALVALAGIPIHLYWALGGTWGLPGGAATAGLPGLHATNGRTHDQGNAETQRASNTPGRGLPP